MTDNEWNISTFQKVLTRFSEPLYYQKLARKLKNAPPDVIHTHFAHVGCAALPLAKQLGVPLVASFYGFDYEQLPTQKPNYRLLYQQLFQEASKIICEGEFGASILEKMGCPKEKLAVIHLGIEPQKVPVLQREKTNKLRLLQAATFTEKKGYIYTLQAFHTALKTCPNMELTLVGEPHVSAIVTEVKDYIQQNKLAEKVQILDFVEYDQFYDFLATFDVFIHPSCYAKSRDCEGGAPIVLLDVQATGMPVISTTHCDIPGEVLHEKTGLLSPEKDVESIAKHIQRFYEMSNEAYQIFAKNARQHVENQFDVRKSGEQLYQLYESILNS